MADIVNILVILSEVTIGLISVTIGVYGIGLPFLKQRMKEFLHELRLSKQKLREDLSRSLGEDLEDIKSEIERHEQCERGSFDEINSITLKRAVIYPGSLFGISLLFSCFFLYIIGEGIQSFSISSVTISIDFFGLLIPMIFLLWGTYHLMKVLKVVESVVLTPEAMPEFEILGFPKEFDVNEEKEIIIELKNVGNEIARNIKAFLYFPVGFSILESSGKTYISTHSHPGLNVAWFELNRLDVRVTRNLGKVRLRAPKSPSEQKMFVTFREERLKFEELVLEIEVRM